MSFLNSISVISGQWEGKTEKLCAMESHLRLERFPPPAGLEPVARRLDQQARD